MSKKIELTKSFQEKLYNKILSLSRNKLLYSNFNLADTFQNRIYLIFIHISFLFIKVKKSEQKAFFKLFNQKIFDYIFEKIELNMREIGHGDVTVNKNMKNLVKNFYNILFFCENYHLKSETKKNSFFLQYLTMNNLKNHEHNDDFIRYIDKYHTFCLDLSSDSVLKGKLNFTY